jgi:hypothetical protein
VYGVVFEALEIWLVGVSIGFEVGWERCGRMHLISNILLPAASMSCLLLVSFGGSVSGGVIFDLIFVKDFFACGGGETNEENGSKFGAAVFSGALGTLRASLTDWTSESGSPLFDSMLKSFSKAISFSLRGSSFCMVSTLIFCLRWISFCLNFSRNLRTSSES